MNYRLLVPAVAAIVMVAGCSKVTRDNFAKVKSDMTTKEVEAILGPPTTSKTITVPIINIEGTEYSYVHEKSTITLQFVNDKLVRKDAIFE